MLKKWFGKSKSKDTPENAESARSEAAPTGEAVDEVEATSSRWKRFTAGLAKTRKSLKTLFNFRRTLDEDFLDELEAELYQTDFGPEVVDDLMNGENGVRNAWKRKDILEVGDVRSYLKDLLRRMLTERDNALLHASTPPTVILVSGVNGAGKTTSIAKLARNLHDAGNKVILAAADTFRAAAVEQLTIWSERIGVECVTGKPEADPASVAFRGAQRAVEENADYLIVDTAGRLHTQKNLMRELAKIRDVLAKKIENAPHEALLVLDATNGQNALSQAAFFQQEIQITGLVLAKLDGTAKGGIVVAINNKLSIPVKFVGVGEQMTDMEAFDPDGFVEALFEEPEGGRGS